MTSLLNAPHQPDPYPFYAALRLAHPSGFHHEPALSLWVASSAEAVNEVLHHPLLHVRPPAEPVPRPLAGSAAGALFGGLMRQNDGPAHAQGKAWASALLQRAWPVGEATHAVVAAGASPRHQPLNTLLFEAPVQVLWRLLRDGAEAPRALPQQVCAVVAAWAPGADAPAREAGSEAAASLLQQLGGEANRVGLFTQTCEATAGLMGAVLVALQREPGLRAQWAADPSLDDALAREVARHDPPVHNTRRFAAAPCTLRGQALQHGEAILVLLASANRDPRATAEPDRFHLHRPEGHNAAWGAGAHACPGAALSRQIAMALVRAWHDDDAAGLERLTRRWHHRPSPNGRLAQFEAEGHEGV